MIACNRNGETVCAAPLLWLHFFSVKQQQRWRRQWTRRLSDVSSCCQSLQHARRLEKRPRETQTGLIMVIIWNKAQSSPPPVASCGGETDSCRPCGPVCCEFAHSVHPVISLPCFSSPSAHLNKSISKLELGLIWGPQIDRILQPGCGDL